MDSVKIDAEEGRDILKDERLRMFAGSQVA